MTHTTRTQDNEKTIAQTILEAVENTDQLAVTERTKNLIQIVARCNVLFEDIAEWVTTYWATNPDDAMEEVYEATKGVNDFLEKQLTLSVTDNLGTGGFTGI